MISLVLLNVHYSLSQVICSSWCLFNSDDVEDALYEESSGRQIQLQNVSLVITYTGMVVAVIMMLGFLYVALNFGGRRSSHGYNYDEYNYEDMYY